MAATHPTLPDLNTLDPAQLKALILAQHENMVAQHETLLSRETEIENLKLLILKLRRMRFGRKSEKLDRHIEQLELRLEDLESAQTASTAPQNDARPQTTGVCTPGRRPARRPLGEDISELLEFVPACVYSCQAGRRGCFHDADQGAAPERTPSQCWPVDTGVTPSTLPALRRRCLHRRLIPPTQIRRPALGLVEIQPVRRRSIRHFCPFLPTLLPVRIGFFDRPFQETNRILAQWPEVFNIAVGAPTVGHSNNIHGEYRLAGTAFICQQIRSEQRRP